MLIDKNTERLIGSLRSIFNDLYIYDLTQFNGKGEKFKLVCRVHGEFVTDYQKTIRYKRGCDLCEKEQLISRRLELVRTKHGDRYDYSKTDFGLKMSDVVTITCKVHGDFEQVMDTHIRRGSNCPECVRGNQTLTLECFITRGKELFNGWYDYTKTVYSKGSDKITITCPEHGDFEQRALSHLAGNGCLKCFNEKVNRSNTDDFIVKAQAIHGSRYDYSQVRYVTNRKPVRIKCPRHGYFNQTPFVHITGKGGCKRCKASKGEVMISTALERMGVAFSTEFKIQLYRYRYDLHLTDTNVLIEYHGIQHFKPIDKFGGVEEFEATVKRDQLKVEIAKEYGYDLIVLNYRHLSKGKLINKLLRELKKRNIVGRST